MAFSGAFVFTEDLPGFFNKNGTLAEIERIIVNDPYVDDIVLKAHRFSHVEILSKYDVFCPERKCEFVSDDGILMTYDKHHLSSHYAKLLGFAYANEIKAALGIDN